MDKQHSNKGLLLKKARESKGIGLETVHESTKIPMDALRAIEEGYTIRTLSQFYLRGFLKIYANYLGIDITEVVEDYQQEKLPPPLPPSQEKKELLAEKITPAFIINIKSWIIKILIGIVVLLVVVKVFGFIVHKISSKKKNAVQTLSTIEKKKPLKLKTVLVEKKKPIEEKIILKEPQPQEASPVPAGQPAVQEVAGKHIDVAVRAKKDTWLQVKIDGQIVFRSTLKKGATETWRAKEVLELSGKDIGDLEFELNGKIVGPLGRENRRAKKVLFDRNGFSVKQ